MFNPVGQVSACPALLPYAMTQKEKYQQNRAELIRLSREVRELMDSGEIEAETVNEALIELYTNPEHLEFRTFWEWKKDGYNVKKGAVSFKVWGRPKESHRITPEDGEDEYKYWPICYLFSNAQVEKAGAERRPAA